MRGHEEGSRRSRSVWRGVVAITVLALLSTAPAFSAAEPAVEADTPSIDLKVQFVLGSALEPWDHCGDYFDVPAVVDVAVAGMQPSNEWSLLGVGSPIYVASGDAGQLDPRIAVSHPHIATSYDGACGGGSITLYDWTFEVMTPEEPDTRTSTWAIAAFDVFDEDGRDLAMNRPDADITTKGRWRTSSCDCWVGGTVAWTRERHAKMHYTAEVAEGEVIAVVMPLAPDRGEARIRLDGVNHGRIDTYAPTSENRIVMWQTPPLEAGVHTVTIVNLATDGRPRIDVDAFLADLGRQPSASAEGES